MAVAAPAVVVGAGANGLGVARSLAREEVPVWLVDSDVRRPEMHTRAAIPVVVRSLRGETLVDELVRLATVRFPGLRPVLFLTQEESVKIVSRQRDRLSALYHLRLPTVDMVDTLLHKQGFQRLAEELGSPVPSLVHVRTFADLPAIGGLRYPVVIKPGERNSEYSRQFKKAYRAESAEDADALLRGILAVMADVVVQEWIDGPDANIYFCLQYVGSQGQVIASFTGRKIRSWPPQVGGTASCAPAPEVQEELSAMTGRFFQSASVIGMASMEYKRDARSGEFQMVEPTIGRTDYQEEVATLNGVNLPYAAYCSELGQPFRASAMKKRPVVWRVRSEDAQSAVAQGQRIKEGYPRGAHVTDALWRWSDPLPYLVRNMRHARHALHARASRMIAEAHRP